LVRQKRAEEKMKELMMQTLWALLEALVMHTGKMDARTVSELAGVELVMVEENDYMKIYESNQPLKMRDGVVVGIVIVRESKTAEKKPFISLSELSGSCITAQAIERHLGELTFPQPPSNPVPDAKITREATFKGHQIVMGFRWGRPDCLYGISPRF
jgi:hypothetical protein